MLTALCVWFRSENNKPFGFPWTYFMRRWVKTNMSAQKFSNAESSESFAKLSKHQFSQKWELFKMFLFWIANQYRKFCMINSTPTSLINCSLLTIFPFNFIWNDFWLNLGLFLITYALAKWLYPLSHSVPGLIFFVKS